MKKLAVICLAIVMTVGASLSVLAEDGAFVGSISGNPAPEVDTVVPEVPECTAEIEVTPYSKREELNAEDKGELEAAYNEIKGTDDLTELNSDLADVAKDLGIKPTELAVSDLFDMDIENCDHQQHKDEHGNLTITLSAKSLENFAGLLHRNGTEWELVEGATVNGNKLTFKIGGDFSPFAIVVKSVSEGEPGDSNMFYVWGVIAAVSAVALAACVIKFKKHTAK